MPDDILTALHEKASQRGGPARRLIEAIEQDHARSREEGVEHPEVDIVAIWRTVLADIWPGFETASDPVVDLQQLAVEYEVRANPAWIMPGLAEVLATLAAAGMTIIFSSHQLDLVSDVCQDVVIIDHGRAVLTGEVSELRRLSPTRHLKSRRIPQPARSSARSRPAIPMATH